MKKCVFIFDRILKVVAQKKILKVKYVFGVLSYGAKIKSDAYTKNHMDICMLHFLGALYGFIRLFSFLPMHL